MVTNEGAGVYAFISVFYNVFKQKKCFFRMQCLNCKETVYCVLGQKSCRCGNVVVYVFNDCTIVCAPLGFARVAFKDRRIETLRSDRYGTYGSFSMDRRRYTLRQRETHSWRACQIRDYVLSAELRIAQRMAAGIGSDMHAILRETRRFFGVTTVTR